MNNGPKQYRPIGRSNADKRQKRLNNQKHLVLAIISSLIIFSIVFITLMISLSVSSAKRRKDLLEEDSSSESSSESQNDPSSNDPADSESQTPALSGDFTYSYKKYSDSAVHLGPLVLVNDEYAYGFGDSTGLLDIRNLRVTGSNGVSIYSMGSYSMLLRKEAIDALNSFVYDFYKNYSDDKQYITLSTAYRDAEDQQKRHESNPSESPEAGRSDYHCGYSFDLSAASGVENATTIFASFNAEQAVNAYKYGIINRYPSGKSDITGNYVDHYRYVGIPHSYIMKEMDYCLEQYIDYIHMHTVSDEHIKYEIEGVGSYDIYYVPATGSVTEVPVPEGHEYTVSGDNVSGFIVTVKIK